MLTSEPTSRGSCDRLITSGCWEVCELVMGFWFCDVFIILLNYITVIVILLLY